MTQGDNLIELIIPNPTSSLFVDGTWTKLKSQNTQFMSSYNTDVCFCYVLLFDTVAWDWLAIVECVYRRDLDTAAPTLPIAIEICSKCRFTA